VATQLEILRTKVERAKKHVSDVEGQLRGFFDTKPYVIGTKRDPQTRRLIYYLTSVVEPSPLLAATVGDALHNLRSALDHLAHRLVVVGIGRSGPFYYVYYPIFDSATEYEAKKMGQIKGMRQSAIDAIDATRPYKGGNDQLWMLHNLDKIDKHRLLIAVGSAARSVDLGGFMSRQMADAFPQLGKIPALSAFFKPADRMCPLKAGDELFIDAPDAKVDQELQFRFDVALSDAGIANGEPVLETLQQMVDLVDNLLITFEPLL
jgi:hypothetical protein